MIVIVAFAIIIFLFFYWMQGSKSSNESPKYQSSDNSSSLATEAVMNDVEDYNYYPEPAEYPAYEKSIYSEDYNILNLKPIDTVY